MRKFTFENIKKTEKITPSLGGVSSRNWRGIYSPYGGVQISLMDGKTQEVDHCQEMHLEKCIFDEMYLENKKDGHKIK